MLQSPSEGGLNAAPLSNSLQSEGAIAVTEVANNELPDASEQERESRSKPRWHTQTYMIFQVLKRHPRHELPRNELIKKAIELDKKMNKETKLGPVFRGKTPLNSASSCLTNNSDKIFVAFKPPGAKTTYFKLAWLPGDLKGAVDRYNSWMQMLMTHDWPICINEFDANRDKEEAAVAAVTGVDATESGDVKNNDDERRIAAPMTLHERSERARQFRNLEYNYDKRLRIKPAVCERNNSSTAFCGEKKPQEKEKKRKKEPVNSETPYFTRRRRNSELDNGDAGTGYLPSPEEKHQHDTVTIDWREVVRVDESLIPNAGRGLFAKRDLPAWIPLGFYFGTPMLEDEFDQTKDGVGLASRYAIMYRRTVLDATDSQGQPWESEEGEVYCPFHFMNEDPMRGNIAFVEGAEVNQIICMTTRLIERGEELFAYYGTEIDREHYLSKAPPNYLCNNI